MAGHRQFDQNRRERGAALLIAIFSLLLISVVAIALIVSSGTDSALASNYRSSSSAYYASLAGIEEARGRLLASDANPIVLPATPMDLTQVVYIINPLNGEAVTPQNTSNPTTYPDTEYKQEFGVDVGARTITTFNSVSAVAGLPGPLYKWVRINALTEKSLGNVPSGGTGPTGVDVNGDGTMDGVTPLFYDPTNMNPLHNAMVPGLIETVAPPVTALQALEITSYAVLPNGSQKMLQYVVRPLVEFPNLNSRTFSAALTLAGNNVTFTGPGPSASGFVIQGQDQCSGSSAIVPSIGYTNSSGGDTSSANIAAGATPTSNYLGAPLNPGPPPAPSTAPQSITDVSSTLNLNWLTPSGLDAVVHDITNGADAVINGPATPSSFPSGMSATHYMTIVVNGDLDLNGWHNTGYGLLLVTGTLKYDPDASWQGLVLVIGQGNFVSTKGGNGEIDGAVFIAKTRDAAGNPLNSLGPSSFSQTGNGSNLGNGIRYNSCYAASAMGPITYKVVSFREIPLAN
jgi:hypothetical protein